MLKTILYGIIKVIAVWSLSIYYSVIVSVILVAEYLSIWQEKPWKCKKRDEPPKCLSDPKYGTHKYMLVNSMRLHYVENGDPSKPLMLFIHGFPEFWYSWRHQITEFSKDYWTIAIDMRGYADSQKPLKRHNYKIEFLAKDIKILIERLNRTQCVLVCHDWGAVIGWSFIEQYKHMVYKYIMMGAPSTTAWSKSLLISPDQFAKSWYIFFFQMPILPEIAVASNDFRLFNEMYDSKFTKYFTEDDLEAYKYTFSQKGALKPAIDFYRTNFPYFKDYKRSNAPLLNDGENGMFLMGQTDRYISQSCSLILQKIYPKLSVEMVPHTNHFVQQNDPITVNKLMKDFLGDASNFIVEPFLT